MITFSQLITESAERIAAVKAKFIDRIVNQYTSYYYGVHEPPPDEYRDHMRRSAENFWKDIMAADPTREKIYLQWLANVYVGGFDSNHFNFNEDFPKIREDLELFDKNKQRLPAEQRDINNLKSQRTRNVHNPKTGGFERQTFMVPDYHVLAKVVEKFRNEAQIAKYSKEELAKWGKQITVVYSGPDGIIAIPHTEEASRFLGRQTRWCTAYTNQPTLFNRYNSQGPLYVFLLPNGDKYQIHLPTNQWMNSSDQDARAVIKALPLFKHFADHIVTSYETRIKNIDVSLGSFPSDILSVDAIDKLGALIRERHAKIIARRRVMTVELANEVYGNGYLLNCLPDGAQSPLYPALVDRAVWLITTTVEGEDAIREYYSSLDRTPVSDDKKVVAALANRYTRILNNDNSSEDDIQEVLAHVFHWDDYSGTSRRLTPPSPEVLNAAFRRAVRIGSKTELSNVERRQLNAFNKNGLVSKDIITAVSNDYVKDIIFWMERDLYAVRKVDFNGIDRYMWYGSQKDLIDKMFPDGVYKVEHDWDVDGFRNRKVRHFPVLFDINYLTPENRQKLSKSIRANLMSVIKLCKSFSSSNKIMIKGLEKIDDSSIGNFVKVDSVAPEITKYGGMLYKYVNDWSTQIYNHLPNTEHTRHEDVALFGELTKIALEIVTSAANPARSERGNTDSDAKLLSKVRR